MRVNFTTFPNDYYHEVYDNAWLNWFSLGCYILGLIGCAFIVFVIWFERSGQAGPNRTLLNQLMTFTLDQGVIFIIFGTGIRTLRAVIGPLPGPLCALGGYFRVYSSINIAILSFARTAFKFAFVFYFRGVPIMEDKFMAIFTYTGSNILSLFAAFSMFYLQGLEGKGQKLCDGQVPELLGRVTPFPVAMTTIFISFACHVVLTIPIFVEKFKSGHHNEVVPFNHQNHQITSFGGILLNWLIELLLVLAAFFSLMFKRLSHEDLATFHGKLVVHMFVTLMPCFNVIVFSIFLIVTKKYLRQAIKRIVSRE